MAKQPRSSVDETARAVSAFFQEILAAGSGPPTSFNGEEREAISVRQFVHFLAHYRVLSTDFTHMHAVKIFLKSTDTDSDGLLYLAGFKSALTSVGMFLREALSTRRMSAGGPSIEEIMLGSTQKKSLDHLALEELAHDINSRRDFTVDQTAQSMLSPLYDVDVIRAAYSYADMLRGLYHHYATVDQAPGAQNYNDSDSNTPGSSTPSHVFEKSMPLKVSKMQVATVSGRSFYRLCCALRMVPMCIVDGELSDMVARRCSECKGKRSSRGAASASERQEQNAERRYLIDNRMAEGSDADNWMVPARGFIQGEPRFTFPELVENLIMAAFVVPPRPFDDLSQVRVQRIHDILGSALEIPSTGVMSDFAPREVGLEALQTCIVEEFLDDIACRSGHGTSMKAETTSRSRRHSNSLAEKASAAPPADFREILVRLSEELPKLPERRDPYLPKPPPAKLADLPRQPETIDEKLLKPPGMRSDSAAAGKNGKGKRKVKTKVKKLGPVELNKVIFYSRREPRKFADVPPQLQIDRRSRLLEENDMRLLRTSEKMKALSVPERGGLRMTLIDEPLRAPRCRRSEEVSTLMETALTARRLRHYEEAVALLIRARNLWAALEAGRVVPADWADVQPLVPAPSPWGDGMVSAAVKVSLKEGTGRSDNGHCSETCRQPMKGPEEKGAAIKQGNIVFRRWQTTCASSHTHRRTGATAAMAAATAAVAGASGSVEEGDGQGATTSFVAPEVDLGDTILPSDLRGDGGGGGGFQSARGLVSRAKSAAAARPGEFETPWPPGGVAANTSTMPVTQGWPSGGMDSRPSRPASAMSARLPGRGSAGHMEHVVPSRRYSAKNDFHLAAGDDNADLKKLPAEAAIFFFCELASLHAAMREDDFAAQLLWRARAPTDRLPNNHPDTAVVWCGIGRMAFLGGAFDVAARATWRGRWIRESTLGGDTVETATSYNNLACCLFALDRPQEALAHLELAEEILRVLAGEDHPRTQTTLRNLEKARCAQKHLHAQVPNIFSLYVPALKVRRGTRKKKKGSKGGSSRASSASTKSSKKK